MYVCQTFSLNDIGVYNQNLVMRSTFGFFGVADGLGVGGTGFKGVDGNCGRPAAAIILVIKCCCIMNIIIDAAIGLNRFGLVPGKR